MVISRSGPFVELETIQYAAHHGSVISAKGDLEILTASGSAHLEIFNGHEWSSYSSMSGVI
jgi:hypothetical protein